MEQDWLPSKATRLPGRSIEANPRKFNLFANNHVEAVASSCNVPSFINSSLFYKSMYAEHFRYFHVRVFGGREKVDASFCRILSEGVVHGPKKDSARRTTAAHICTHVGAPQRSAPPAPQLVGAPPAALAAQSVKAPEAEVTAEPAAVQTPTPPSKPVALTSPRNDREEKHKVRPIKGVQRQVCISFSMPINGVAPLV